MLGDDQRRGPRRVGRTLLAAAMILAAHGSAPADEPAAHAGLKPGSRLERRGDEIAVCGQLYHTTTPVVLWSDPGGYDAYRLEPRFKPLSDSIPPARKEDTQPALRSTFGLRRRNLSADDLERVRGGGWDLPTLRKAVDQFVIHYDVCGTSRRCFQVLHDQRNLSVHFMLDADGTIYQTLDLKEQAWHATIANARSIGIEIANMGAYPPASAQALDRWYRTTPGGDTFLTIPDAELPFLRDRDAVLRPARAARIGGNIQGQDLVQYDLTERQYQALIRLTATLCTLFPGIRCDYPKDASGKLIPVKIPNDQLDRYRGIVGHFHVQTNKTDPGPAFQWDKLVDGTKALLSGSGVTP
ncbi:N-acetyl-anhydromuranmyl-L-alanine amidase [Aquisphaera giovannonii]|uniref:N-acetylmuramoyl-L-alanine amidase n=1 Tax=Aquisphaera giovannonii TaxID=406548 RepID=A0A5B9VXL4_9BACT|nr:peptidoglycan recognition family protein [Aquisphaera giovannonii]QEH33116.1 N-acetyl-anhydromuranmyl-L-alanine amidase [Aquisphaera giovannonii]